MNHQDRVTAAAVARTSSSNQRTTAAAVAPFVSSSFISSSSSSPSPGDNTVISQYDVLLVEVENELALIPHNHIGNNRLGVFVQIHLPHFLHADDLDGQNQVIRDVMAMVERQCVDDICQRTGKFLYCTVFRSDDHRAAARTMMRMADDHHHNDHDHDDVWNEVPNTRVVEFLRQRLEREQAQMAEISSNSSTRSNVLVTAAATASSSNNDANNHDSNAAVTTAVTTTAMEEDDFKKRRRRSSLLRRSMSWDNVVDGQKKKILQRQSILLQLEQYDVSEEEQEEEQEEETNDEKDDENMPQQHRQGGDDDDNDDDVAKLTTDDDDSNRKTTSTTTTTTKLPEPERDEPVDPQADDPTLAKKMTSPRPAAPPPENDSALSQSPFFPSTLSSPPPIAADALPEQAPVARAADSDPSATVTPSKPNSITSATDTITNSTGTSRSKPAKRLERRSSFTDVLPHKDSSATMIHTANALDVLLERHNPDHDDDDDSLCATGCCYRLHRNHTGNNRLAVMIDLRSGRYKEAVAAANNNNNNTNSNSKLEVHRLCMELVHAVTEHYHGRFLLLLDPLEDDKFLALSDEQAAAAIATIFKEEDNNNNNRHNSKRSTNNVSNMSASMNDSSSSFQSFSDNSFSSLPANLQVPTNAHQAALASLHRRKKRNETSTKLSQIVSRNHQFSPAPLLAISSGSGSFRGQQMLGARASSVGVLDTQQPDSSDNEMYQPLRVQRRASSGRIDPAPRRSTLSHFSQEMIRDLLLRLEESHDNSAPVAGGELDDLF
jgi:hypothetical protein